VGDVTLLIGPEGGLSEAEVTAAQASGWVLAGLGNTVLRADTAAVAAMVRYG
jgi:16S rRNA (uracil1498-N3)-methyltransferase